MKAKDATSVCELRLIAGNNIVIVVNESDVLLVDKGDSSRKQVIFHSECLIWTYGTPTWRPGWLCWLCFCTCATGKKFKHHHNLRFACKTLKKRKRDFFFFCANIAEQDLAKFTTAVATLCASHSKLETPADPHNTLRLVAVSSQLNQTVLLDR